MSNDGGRGAPDDTNTDAGLIISVAEIRKLLGQNAEAAERNVDKFCEMNREVAKNKLLAPSSSNTKDAAIFMSSRADWEGGSIGSLHLPAPLMERMANGAWTTLPPSAYQGLDFGWMTELLEFDQWSMGATGPLRNNDIQNFFEAPIPNFISLQQWAKLRLLKGRLENDLPRASLEVRHVAQLCGSTNLLIGEMIRVSMYGIERRFFSALGLEVPPELPSESETQDFRKTALAAMRFAWPGVPKAVREKALACSNARCSTITEALSISAESRAVLPEAQETFDWLMSQKQCDAQLAQNIARSPGSTAEKLAPMFESGSKTIDEWLSPPAP